MQDTDVLHYDLDLEISSISTGTNSCVITGTNRMTFQSKSSALSDFSFRLRNQYSITSALINDSIPVSVTTTSSTTRTVTLDQTYGMDEVFTLTIAYTGTSVSVAGSIQVQSFGGSSQVVATLSEPYYAYTWWPAKDGDVGVPGDNSDKATFEFSMTAPNSLVVASNGFLEGVDDLGGGKHRYRWVTDYPMVTYLLSFAAASYNTWSKNYVHPGGTMPVLFYVYPDASWDNPSNRTSWEKCTDMMAVYRPLYGEYPFLDEKYGLYNFLFSGGMEHQTMTGQNGFSESLTAHELTHQWWGDMITCEKWNDIWLNEGFATYGEVLWFEYKTGVQDPAAYASAILARKPTSFTGSVYLTDAETASVNRIFDTNLSYRKGAWVLHMLRHVVGDADFFQILADYRTAFEYASATTDDFAAVASSTHGSDLTWFFDEWIYGNGAPNYRYGWGNVVINGEDYTHVKIAQVQTILDPPFFTMPVDIVLTVNGTPTKFTVWNNLREQWFVIPVSAPATAMQFDPNQWVLRSGAILTTFAVGDIDDDGDRDAADFGLFSGCFTGSGGDVIAECAPSDLDGDGDADCVDWAAYLSLWPGPGDPPDMPLCIGPNQIPAVSIYGAAAMTLTILSAGSILLFRRKTARCI